MHTYTHTYVLYIIHTLQYQTLYVDDSNVQVAHYFGGDIYVVYVGMSISAPLASKLYPSSNGIESSTDKKNYPHKHFDASVKIDSYKYSNFHTLANLLQNSDQTATLEQKLSGR